MKVLFISRAYPPIVGGMENQNYELSIHLPHHVATTLIVNPYGKKNLPFFLPYATIMALFKMRSCDILLLGDGVLAIIGYIIKSFYRHHRKVFSILHGLDVTYPMWLYQKLWIKNFLPKLDGYIAVGNETIRQGVIRGLMMDKFTFIPNGIAGEKLAGSYDRGNLKKILRADIDYKYVLLTCGRLVQRKGVAWFIDQVMPRLDEKILYVVAGDGPERANITKTIKRRQLSARVKMLGRVTSETLKALLNTCDIFIQPNIRVNGDMEGFGISVLEAGACGLPVVASRIEGLQDAIRDGENGILAESGNALDFQGKIESLLHDEPSRRQLGTRARTYNATNYHWDIISRRYSHYLASPKR